MKKLFTFPLSSFSWTQKKDPFPFLKLRPLESYKRLTAMMKWFAFLFCVTTFLFFFPYAHIAYVHRYHNDGLSCLPSDPPLRLVLVWFHGLLNKTSHDTMKASKTMMSYTCRDCNPWLLNFTDLICIRTNLKRCHFVTERWISSDKEQCTNWMTPLAAYLSLTAVNDCSRL
jgi:hypothetical protein